MNTQNWKDTLSLLCIMILADEKVYQEEVESFQNAAVALRDALNPKLMLTRHMAQEWFVVHKEELQQSISDHNKDKTVAGLLNNLRDLPERKELLVALMKIAMSDGHRHTSEVKIIERATQTWELEIAS